MSRKQHKPLSAKQRSDRHRAKMQSQGYTQRLIWLSESSRKTLLKFKMECFQSPSETINKALDAYAETHG